MPTLLAVTRLCCAVCATAWQRQPETFAKAATDGVSRLADILAA
ncbi:MAG: hypothetical protein Q4A85_12425 [Kingella sp. (in: b-proteobacteria)]|nr:hypothetical protein [Kingella sp. (in: b-proteobacteria)]